jgi:hypothetical protein
MSSPFDVGRDGSYTGGSYGFGDPTAGDLASDHEAQVAEGFSTQLPDDDGDDAGVGADLPSAGRFTYPWLRGEGGRLADD